jgi:hypothetical protein
MYGNFLAKNTVCAPYIPINVWFWPALFIVHFATRVNVVASWTNPYVDAPPDYAHTHVSGCCMAASVMSHGGAFVLTAQFRRLTGQAHEYLLLG